MSHEKKKTNPTNNLRKKLQIVRGLLFQSKIWYIPFLILSFEAQKSLTTKSTDTVSYETAALGPRGTQERQIKDAACLKQKEGKTQPPALICSLSQKAMFYTWHEVIRVIF